MSKVDVPGEPTTATNPAYFNWDHPAVRAERRRAPHLAQGPHLAGDTRGPPDRSQDRGALAADPRKPCFRVSPYGPPRFRAVTKERKLYLWDWSELESDGPRFDNMVACQLLKYCHWVEDTQGHAMELRYLRDTDKREVDFVIVKDRKPAFAVEC